MLCFAMRSYSSSPLNFSSFELLQATVSVFFPMVVGLTYFPDWSSWGKAGGFWAEVSVLEHTSTYVLSYYSFFYLFIVTLNAA
jgi:hypothetical protein